MRRSLLLAFTAITLFATGCKEDFDIAAPYKDITLVYGMLDVDSTVNYIRIQKAFLSQDQSSIDMAKVSDSSFYADGAIDVKMRVLNNGNIVKSVDMPRVQVADKAPGAFFTGPNYAYKLSDTLDRDYTYRLVIKNNKTGDVDSSETALIPSDTMYQSGSSGNFYVDIFGDASINQAPTPMKFDQVGAGRTYTFIVQTPANSAVIEGFIRFFYWEKNNSTGSDVQKYVDYPLNRIQIGKVNETYRIENLSFYEFFASNIAPANGLERHMDTAQMFIYASTKDFLNYSVFTESQISASLTSNEIKPIYTNLKGKDVYGLFTSRALRWGKALPLAPETIDALHNNVLTSALGISEDPSDK